MQIMVVNLVAQLKTALHLSYSNYVLSQVFSSAALVALLPVNPSRKMATNKCATELQSIKHLAQDFGIPDALSRTKIYYYNQADVQWAASVNSKGIKNLNLRENMV